MAASGSANIVPGPQFQAGWSDKLDSVPQKMLQVQLHIANPVCLKWANFHHTTVGFSGKVPMQMQMRENRQTYAKQNRHRAEQCFLSSSRSKSKVLRTA